MRTKPIAEHFSIELIRYKPIVMKPFNTMEVPRTEYGTTASSATRVAMEIKPNQSWWWEPSRKLVDSKTPLEFVVVCLRGSISSSHLRGGIPRRKVFQTGSSHEHVQRHPVAQSPQLAGVHQQCLRSCRFPTVSSQVIGASLGWDQSNLGTTTRLQTLDESGTRLPRR